MRPPNIELIFITNFQIVSCWKSLLIACLNLVDTGFFRTFAPAIEKKASLVPKVGLYRRHIWVSIGVRRRTSITTQIRARNGASGELKYQPSKHTQVWLTTVLPCAQWTVTSLLSIRLNHVSTRQNERVRTPTRQTSTWWRPRRRMPSPYRSILMWWPSRSLPSTFPATAASILAQTSLPSSTSP